MNRKQDKALFGKLLLPLSGQESTKPARARRMNTLAATEYVNDIYTYYKRVEHKFLVPADYMKQQVRCGDVGLLFSPKSAMAGDQNQCIRARFGIS